MHQIEWLLLLVLGFLPTLALAETTPLPAPLAALENKGLNLRANSP